MLQLSTTPSDKQLKMFSDGTYKAEDEKCYEYYITEDLLIGMTELVEIECPLGVQSFDSYTVNLSDANR